MQEALVDHLLQIAHLFGKAKEPWKSKAFSKVANELKVRRMEILISDGAVQTKIPGAGSAINDVIVQFLSTGTSEKMAKLKTLLPNEVIERFDASTCKRKVSELLSPLTKAGVDWGFAGSMRRGLQTVKDVDVIVCLTDEAKERALVEKILSDAGLAADVRNGAEKVGVSIPIKSQGRSFTLDLNFTRPEYKGGHYLYFTGPKAYNIAQRGRAKDKGFLLNQKGLFKDNELVSGATEKDIFAALGEMYLEPEQRA